MTVCVAVCVAPSISTDYLKFAPGLPGRPLGPAAPRTGPPPPPPRPRRQMVPGDTWGATVCLRGQIAPTAGSKICLLAAPGPRARGGPRGQQICLLVDEKGTNLSPVGRKWDKFVSSRTKTEQICLIFVSWGGSRGFFGLHTKKANLPKIYQGPGPRRQHSPKAGQGTVSLREKVPEGDKKVKHHDISESPWQKN